MARTSRAEKRELIDIDQEFLAREAASDAEGLAGKVAQALVGAIKAVRCYEAGHRNIRAARQKLQALLAPYLDRYDILVLEVGATTFAGEGRVLYACEEVKGSVPFLFYQDGIRELHLLRGLDEKELDAFLSLIARAGAVNNLEDDLVTLLWEREFPHLDFLAVDSYLDEMAVTTCETAEELRAHLPAEPPAHQVEVALGEEGEEFPPLPADKALYRLTPEELARLQREAQALSSPEVVLAGVWLLLDMLPLAPGPEVFAAEIAQVQQQLDTLCGAGAYRLVGEALLRIGAAPALRQALAGIDAAQWREILRSAARGQPAEAEARLAQLLLLQPAHTLPAIARLLADAGGPRVLEAGLLAAARANLDAVLFFLEGETGATIRPFLRVLGEVGGPRAGRALGMVLGHRDAGMRIEAATALAKIASESAWRAIAGLLADADETVRCRAAALLGETGGAIARDALLAVAAAPAFRHRSPEEARVCLIALGHCGGPGVVEALRRLMRVGGWRNRRTLAIIRQCARQALAELEPVTPPARGLRQFLGGLWAARPARRETE